MKDAAATNWVIEVGEEDFEREVIERSRQVPVLIDFWAPWCQPCQLLGPMLEAHAKEQAGAFVVAKVNIDESQNLASYFQVEGIPTVTVIRDGQLYPGFQGILSEEELRDFIKQIVPSESDNAVKEAFALEATEPVQAENMYRIVLSQQPEHEFARVSLARLLVAQHKYPEASEWLAPLGVSDEVGIEAERLRRIIELGDTQATGDEASLQKKVAADPENPQHRFELGSVLAAQNRYPEALEMLISAAERDKKYAQNQVRELMVKIFQIIGIRSEMSDDYRSRLQSLLY